ncbi:hypothetical protein RF11_08360 [Thelohanellus kitauei]|uniref:Uncharacterized protein n=1 Tax=Thelohanellus kitauei TaxID=669202 RepID=A0A0C2N5Z1_THEKT|nr:hypothetical protein RF11_08360 [Thelohanellus kitauei]
MEYLWIQITSIHELSNKVIKAKISTFTSTSHTDFKVCHDKAENLIYVHTSKTNEKSASAIYVIDLKENAESYLKNVESADGISVDKMFCQSGLLILSVVGEDKIWVRNQADDSMFRKDVGQNPQIFFSEEGAKDVALLTEDKKVYILDLEGNSWALLSEDAVSPQW